MSITETDKAAVNEFTRVARMIYPRLVWEELETEAGQIYLLVYDQDGFNGPSWFIEQVPAAGLVEPCWVVIAAHRGDHVMYTGGTPAGALEGATEVLKDYLERAATSAVCGQLEHLTVDRQLEGVL